MSYSKFLRLSTNKILYYSQLKKVQNKYIMKGLWIDDGSNGSFIFAKEGHIGESSTENPFLYMTEAHVHTISPGLEIETESKDKLIWPLPKHSNLKYSMTVSVNKLPEEDTLGLYRAMAAAKELSDSFVNYIGALFWLRIIPFLLSFCICILYVSIGSLAHIETLAKSLKLAFLNFAFSFAFLYTFLYFVIY